MKAISIATWFARSGLLFLSCSLFGCIVIHSDSTSEEKIPPENTLSQKEHLSIQIESEQSWNCSAAAATEIKELHEFFEAWYKGSTVRSDENFSRLTNVISDEFQLITATGFTVNKALLFTLMKGGYGSKRDLTMRVEEINHRMQGDSLCLLTYEEYGNTEGGLKKVLVSALLRRAPEKRNGLEWLHVHEVNVPMQDQEASERENKEPVIIP